MSTANTRRKNSGGRPPKFAEPSRPVTVTLPLRVLEQLHRLDADRARAIATAVDAVLSGDDAAALRVDLVEVSPGASMLVVPANRSLMGIPWLKLIKVAPARYLLTIEPGTSIEKVELTLLDMIRDADESLRNELPMLEDLAGIFSEIRRRGRITKSEILLFTSEE